jgi:hypothetical protein
MNPLIYAGLPAEEKTRYLMNEVDIKMVIERAFEIKEGSLFLKSRKREICNGRQLYCSIAYHVLKHSDLQIERSACAKNHATVIHGRKVTALRLTIEKGFRVKVIKILTDYMRLKYGTMGASFLSQQVAVALERMMRNESHKDILKRKREERVIPIERAMVPISHVACMV